MTGQYVRAWWKESVDYGAHVQYFTKRTMSESVKMCIGLGTGLNAVISLAILLPAAGTLESRIAVAAFALLQFFWSWVWCCRPWPTRRMSLAFVVSADIGITAVALLDGSWLLGLFAFNALMMISVFLMFFDGPKALAGHVLWILLSTTAFALRVGTGGLLDEVAFAAKTLATVALMVAIPLGIQFGIWAMRNEANESVTDPLTGLLNRRGLHLHLGDLLRGTSATDTEVAVMVVDLDHFKDINDTYGHPVGDEVLIRSARRITSAVRGSALVARVGGEEFVIVDLAGPGQAERSADRVRNAIAAPADRAITASVGVTSIAIDGFADAGDRLIPLLDTIIEHADHAMFDAKRNGGNATVHIPLVDGNPERMDADNDS